MSGWVAEGGDERAREFVQEWLDHPDTPMPSPAEIVAEVALTGGVTIKRPDRPDPYEPAVPVILGTLAAVAQARAKRGRR